jgi:hypothetical protein
VAIDTTGPAWQPALRVAANSRANLKSLWFFTVLWNVVSAPLLVYVPPELERQPLAALGFLFPLVGVGLLWWAAVTTVRLRRFGDTWLDTASGPARPGGRWQANIHARLPQPADTDDYTVCVKLTCLRRTISGHDGDREEREHILWREDIEVTSTRIAFGAELASIPVYFDIPADALQTTAVGKGEGVLWVLTAEAALPGVNLREDFDVPVRGGDNSDPSVRRARSWDAAAVSITAEDLARTGIMVEPVAEGTRVRFAPRRNISFAVGLTAFTAVWTGALWVQWYLGFPWIFPIVTGLVDLLLAWLVLELWLGTTTVTVGAGTVRVRHARLGIGSTRTVAGAEIASIELHIGMQTQGRYGTPYYDVRARLKNGRKVMLGSGVRNKRHAEWLADRIASGVGTKRAA